MRGPMRQNTVGCIPSLAGLRPISMEESSVSNLVLSTGSNHYVIHVPAHSYAHPIHVTRTCNKPSFQTILLQGIFGYQFEGSPEKRGNLIKQSMCSMWSEEGIEIPLVIFNNKDKHKVQRQRERRKALLLWFDCIGRWACVLVGFASTEAMFRKFGLSKRATGWARGPTLSPSAARKKSLTLLLVNHCFRLFLLFIVLNLTFLVQVFFL